MLRRIGRLVGWVVVAVVACGVFVWAGRWSPTPLRWSDLSGWLREAGRDDAFVELVRWIGVVLSAYVGVSALLALAAELAGAARLVSVARVLARVGRMSAVPMLRERLWRSVSSVAMSASSVVMVSSGAVAAGPSTPAELSIDAPPAADDAVSLPDGLVGSFSGFGIGEAPSMARLGSDVVVSSPELVERVVERGDTVWDLARSVYGRVDAGVVERLAAVNELEDPSLIFAGQRLVFPPLATAMPPPSVDQGASWGTHTVVAGDTLWEVLESHYGWVTADLVWHVASVNGLADPGQIEIGTVLALPGLASHTDVPPIDPTPPPPDTTPQATSDDSVLPPPHDPAVPVEPTTTVTPPPTLAPTTPASAPPFVETDVATTAPADTVSASTVPIGDSAARGPLVDDVVIDDGDLGLFDATARTLWWQVPMGLMLAAGLGAMARRLRGRRAARLSPGEQLVEPPPVAAGTELAVRAAAPERRVSTLQALLRSLTPHAREQHDPAPVRVVEVAEDRVEVLFAGVAPFPPAGWSTVNGGRSWTHDLSGEVSVSVRQLVTPALVTLGSRAGGGEVLLDVETAGSLALVGDRDAALGVARSMVLELATYPLGVPMDVCLIGLAVDGVEHCDRVWPNTTLTRAVRVAREVLERNTATGAVSLIAARAATDNDTGELDPQVFVVDLANVADADGHLVDELVEVCQSRSGAATIVIGAHPRVVETLELRSDGVAVWSGARLTPPVVAREAAAQVAVMFDHLAKAPTEPMTIPQVVIDAVAETDREGSESVESPVALHDGPDVVEFVYEPPPFEVLVRCLGEVTVDGREITQAGEVELLTLLTLQRERRPNIDTIYTMLVEDPFLARGKTVSKEPLRPMQQRVSRLRAKLGTDAHGNDLLPPAKPGRGSPSRYTVSEQVLTDVELLQHRYHTSLELASNDAYTLLRDGLALFRGPMLRARKGYSWAATEGITSRIGTFVIAYAVRLMELAFERDDIASVLETVRCCGLVLDDPLVELQAWHRVGDFADSSANPDLVAAVHEARRRLASYVDDTDPVADADV